VVNEIRSWVWVGCSSPCELDTSDPASGNTSTYRRNADSNADTSSGTETGVVFQGMVCCGHSAFLAEASNFKGIWFVGHTRCCPTPKNGRHRVFLAGVEDQVSSYVYREDGA
jgi:hypothetical protein